MGNLRTKKRLHLAALALVPLSLLLLLFWFPPSGAVARGGSDDRLQAELRECANRTRARNGLPKLRNSKPLNQAASLHAHDMARRGYFDHVSPDGRDPAQRVDLFASRGEFEAVGENIAAGQARPKSACSSWLDSAGHRANILSSRYSSIGGGFAQGGPYGAYYVQVFAER